MNELAQPSPPASTLELAKHDVTAGAPERTLAPQSNQETEAPQVLDSPVFVTSIVNVFYRQFLALNLKSHTTTLLQRQWLQ